MRRMAASSGPQWSERVTDPKPAQRDVMRLLYKEHGGDKTAVVAAYAKAEAESRVARDSNEHKLDATAYAETLYADGVRKGWIA